MNCRVRKEFAAQKAEIPQVHDFVRSTLEANGVAGVSRDDLVLACDEAATNIVEHAFAERRDMTKNNPHFILALNCQKNRVTATFFDSGLKFDPQAVAEPDFRKNLAGERRGGYGLYLIRRLVDKIVYSARRRLNITRLVKEVSGQNAQNKRSR